MSPLFTGKLLSGQFGGYSPDTFNTNDINEIQRQTSQTPAILGCDYACGWNKKTPPQNIIDYSCNPSLKDHWNKGGLVTVNMHLPNPVTTDGGAYKERLNLNFADLLNTNNPTGQRWRAMMDRIAAGLDDLQRAGVTVLYRPLHEMNGDWFYWCDQVSRPLESVRSSLLSALESRCLQERLERHVQLFHQDEKSAQSHLGLFARSEPSQSIEILPG
jgi:mannan endo-1,4-beta-mannosidase